MTGWTQSRGKARCRGHRVEAESVRAGGGLLCMNRSGEQQMHRVGAKLASRSAATGVSTAGH